MAGGQSSSSYFGLTFPGPGSSSSTAFILEHRIDGDLVMVASPAHVSARWAFEYASQTAGYLRAALQPGR
jgi:hypothetical protein